MEDLLYAKQDKMFHGVSSNIHAYFVSFLLYLEDSILPVFVVLSIYTKRKSLVALHKFC